jgi:hypothetical protein
MTIEQLKMHRFGVARHQGLVLDDHEALIADPERRS